MDLKEEVEFLCEAGQQRKGVPVPQESCPQGKGSSVPLPPAPSGSR